MNTYFTDAGISAVAVAGIALVVKIWDAINDPIFGGIIDRIHFKKGKFVPWLRISLIGIPLATILLFAIPNSLPMGAKIAWAVLSSRCSAGRWKSLSCSTGPMSPRLC